MTMFSFLANDNKVAQVLTEIELDKTLTENVSATNEVFKIDELREKILEYAILKGNSGKLSCKTAKSLRLVQKNWLQTTSRLLRRLKQPLVMLKLDANNHLMDSVYFTAEHKLLNQFVARLCASKLLPESFLTIKLDLTAEYFSEKNYQSLSEFFTLLGENVVELKLQYPKSGGTMPSILPSFAMHLLSKFSFTFSDQELIGESDEEEEFGDNRSGLWMLQSILNASESLKDLVLPFTLGGRVVPIGIKYLQLPTSISTLDISTIMTNSDLEFLIRNQMPNVAHFTLLLNQDPFKEELVFKVLERFQKTLQSLRFDGLESAGQPRQPTFLRLPLLSKLTKITMACIECELGPRNMLALQKCLPALIDVLLEHQTEVRITRWIQNSTFENVVELWVSVVDEQLGESNDNFFLSPSLNILTKLHQSFYNVRSLGLTVNINDINGLKYIFQNITQLELLSISFAGNQVALENSSDLIDAVLLGLSLRLVSALKEDICYLESVEIKHGKEPSIRNLSALRTLILRSKAKDDNSLHHVIPSTLISDLLFRHAFMKMNNLRKLALLRKFKPSSEMQNMWRKEGRIITYSPA